MHIRGLAVICSAVSSTSMRADTAYAPRIAILTGFVIIELVESKETKMGLQCRVFNNC
jgi:hypothetical protein